MKTPEVISLELPRLHDAQRQILKEAKRFNVLRCGRRWGKTTLGMRLLAQKIDKPCAWFAPYYKLLDEVWREVQIIFAPIIKVRDSQQKRLGFISGGSLDFWTMDDPVTVARGRRYARVIVDEAAMTPYLEQAWQQAIRPTLADFRGDAFFLSTPKGKNFFATLCAAHLHHPDWQHWQMSTFSNPHILPEEIEAARLDIPEIVYRQEFLAEIIDQSGAVLSAQWLKPTPSIPPLQRIVMGVDLAISMKSTADYTAAVILGQAADGKLFVVDAQRVRAPFNEVLQFIQTMAQKWSPMVIGIEQVQYQAAVVQELLRTTRLPVRGVTPDKDKQTRFLPVAARYEQGLIYHSANLHSTFDKELLAFPLGEHDDQVDALSLAYQMLSQFSPSTPITQGRSQF